MVTHKQTAEMLRAGREEIVVEISRQISELSPEHHAVDATAGRRSLEHQLDLLIDVLDGAAPDRFLAQMHDEIELRYRGGIPPAALFASSHMYLPAIREVFLRREAALEGALDAFRVVERVLLPLLCQIGANLFQLADLEDEISTDPANWLRSRSTDDSPFKK